MAASAKKNARERLAAQRLADEARKKRVRMLAVAGVVGALVLALIGIMFAVNASRRPTTPDAGGSYLSALTSVTAAQLDAVGTGSARNTAEAVPGGKAVVVDGKPRVLYVGTEYCPYCGMERWPLTIALSRFGTFAGLAAATTPANEGSVPTVSFKDSTYTSQYLVFDGVETADAQGRPLESLSADDQAAMKKLDPQSSVPWVYWGTTHQVGASYEGSFLAGADPAAVAAKLADADSAEAKAILGAANIHTARLCQLTGNQPGDVCSSAGVQAAAKVLR